MCIRDRAATEDRNGFESASPDRAGAAVRSDLMMRISLTRLGQGNAPTQSEGKCWWRMTNLTRQGVIHGIAIVPNRYIGVRAMWTAVLVPETAVYLFPPG